ncbi:Gmad2 immunoglobulin-like domain-containing protein [Candidatus Uhrbacteria bacterium]|nr:Gmad2 immunoglobulin-like domain-containing protein [Candidatus Uhrbacteria bacterium]
MTQGQRIGTMWAIAGAVIVVAALYVFWPWRQPNRAPVGTPPPAVTPISDLIQVDTPQPDQRIQSPLVVRGRARGLWYFEASFPVTLKDATGKVIAQVSAQAQGEWMTQEFVPFAATIKFTNPATETGTIVLEKDNPSGLLESADAITIPVRFSVGASAVNIQAQYDSKIVYKLPADNNSVPYQNDCQARGGTFDPCGSPCAPSAPICIQMCAYVCRLKK